MLFKPEDPGPEPGADHGAFDDPKALPTIAVWLLLAAAMAFSAAVAHSAQPNVCGPHDAADAGR